MTITIIDDARIIREGLKKIIMTNCPAYQIVGEAADGEKGYELVVQTHPDVCIVDMKMPKFNGIDMVARIREKYQDIRFIVLSGYAEFDYARTMISYGCVAYLLKPVNHAELIGILNSLAEKASQRKTVAVSNENPDVIERLLAGSLEANGASLLPEALSTILRNLTVMAVCQVDASEDGTQFNPQDIKAQALVVFSSDQCYAHVIDEQQVVLFLTGQESGINERLSDLILSISKKYKQHISIGAYRTIEDSQPVSDVLRMAVEALNRCFHREWGALCWYVKSVPFDELPLFFVIEEQIIRNMIMENHDGAVEKLQALIQELKHYEVQKEHSVLLLTRVYLTMRKILVKQKAQQLLDSIPKSAELKESMLQCARMFQVEQLIAVVSEKIQEFDRETSKYDTSKRATIRKVLRYMDQNYSKGLTLPEVAKVAHMAPSYFSMYFKKEMGENYNQFVNRMKIERAKELLQNPSVKIHEVGTLVGFEDSKYFSRKFRTITGMTPREYRESISVCKE